MKLAVILNGLSLKKPHFYKNTIPALERYFAVEVFETRSKNDAIGLATKAVAKKFDVIVSAGGDGTLHQVINGMLTDVGDMERLPALAVLPLGSGNDFARTLYVTPADIDIVEILREFKTVSCDVGELTYSVLNSLHWCGGDEGFAIFFECGRRRYGSRCSFWSE